MSINRNQIPTSETFEYDYLSLKDKSSVLHNTISNNLYSASVLYQESSALEDVVLENFLSLYTELKNIDFTNKNRDTVVESFLTTRYSDSNFSVSKRLNIDILNGDLTLPIKDSENLDIESIIIESDSNGNLGDNILNDDSKDINSIVNNSSSIFKYDTITNNLDSSGLVLSLSFKLKNISILNSIYIKLFSISKGIYPSIDEIEISEDGVIWTRLNNNYNTNKADYYIRFSPTKTQFIRIRFKQNHFNNIKTLFGYKYQYLIGIREITLKKDEYDISGEYVSLPYSTSKTINSVLFNKIDIQNNDIKYMLSANNGGKWIDINDSQIVELINENVGVLDTTDIKDIRVKILMNKSESILNTSSHIEYFSYSNSKYYLKQSPRDIYVFCGKNISFGGEYTYLFNIQSSTSEIVLLGISYEVASLKDLDGNNLLAILKDGARLDDSSYSIYSDTNKQNTIIRFNSVIEAGSLIEFSLSPFLYKSPTDNKIVLPIKSFYDDKSNFYITEYVGSVSVTGGNILDNSKYIATSTVDSTMITILGKYFKKNAIYSIKYAPAFKVLNNIIVDTNEVSIDSLNLKESSSLRFDYLYNNPFDINLVKYYTPIVNEYRVRMQ